MVHICSGKIFGLTFFRSGFTGKSYLYYYNTHTHDDIHINHFIPRMGRRTEYIMCRLTSSVFCPSGAVKVLPHVAVLGSHWIFFRTKTVVSYLNFFFFIIFIKMRKSNVFALPCIICKLFLVRKMLTCLPSMNCDYIKNNFSHFELGPPSFMLILFINNSTITFQKISIWLLLCYYNNTPVGGGGGLINGLACGEQCRCRTRPCHRQRLVTRQNRPPLRARGYDAAVSRLAVSRVFRGEVAYIIETDPSTHISSPSFFPNVVLFFFRPIFVAGKNSRVSRTAKITLF